MDTDTGERLTDINEGDRILRKQSIEAMQKSGELYDVWRIEHFYKGNLDEVRKQLECLTVYEKAFMFSIVAYVGYQDCCIKYDNGRCMDFDDLVKISGISRSKVSDVINTMRKKDIIYKGMNSQGIQYFINPWLFCKGNRVNAVLKTMFKNYHIKVMNNVKWGDLKDR